MAEPPFELNRTDRRPLADRDGWPLGRTTTAATRRRRVKRLQRLDGMHRS